MPAVEIIGANDTIVWGMTSETRICRIAKAFLDASGEREGTVIADTGYAFDPKWFAFIADRKNTALTIGDRPALLNVADDHVGRVRASIEAGNDDWRAGIETIRYEGEIWIYDLELRKREKPFLMPLTPATVRAIERLSYFGAYKGATDVLTKYLWPEWALVLTRVAARIGMSPNMVTAIGAAFCVWTIFLFADGRYWAGMASGLLFMVLDTVDGKLARCTITSSWWGNVFDHGIDLIHPPFWWYAWGIGLAAHGLAFSPEMLWGVMSVLVVGYVLQRLIEGDFIRRTGMHIHVWQKIDTDFRLITARRNPNMVILFACLVFGRPDIGLIAITVWTLLSLLFHTVRLGQAIAALRGGRALNSWLSDGSIAQ